MGEGRERKALNLELMKVGLAWWPENYGKKAYKLRDAMESVRKARLRI